VTRPNQFKTRPSQGPHVSVLLHHCHQLLNELRLGETFFYLPPGDQKHVHPNSLMHRDLTPFFWECRSAC
jgi:hypothetical protein